MPTIRLQTSAMLLLCLSGAAAPCDAQRWSVGVRAGINATRMAFWDDDAQSLVRATPGFHIGTDAGVRLKGALQLNSGLLFTEKGFDSDDEKLDLSYLELPLLLSLHWPVALAPHLFAGPVMSFEVSCRSSRVPGLGELACDAALASAQRKRTDVGLAFGVGVGFPVGPGSLSFDLWVNQGLRDISREVRPSGWVRNQALLVSVGYRYSGGTP